MSFFRSMWKSSGKHQKLEPGDEKCLAKSEEEPSTIMPEVVSFTVKYLGSTIVSNNVTTATAVDTILTMAKVAKRKITQVNVVVTLNGITVTDCKTGSLILDASVYRISNCSTDPARSNVFTFYATNKYDITECHAFRCPKRKMAQTVTLTVADSFRTAYEVWQRGNQVCSKLIEEKPVSEPRIQKDKKHLEVQLIDLSESKQSSNINGKVSNDNSSWVRFENDKEELPKNSKYFKNDSSLQPPELYKDRILLLQQQQDKFGDNFNWT